MNNKDTIKSTVNNLIPELINSIKDIVSYKSVLDEIPSSYPFGKGIDDCLKSTLNLCSSLGFRTYYDPEGYYGYAEIGEGDDLIGVLGHLDVVPEGDLTTWSHPPYQLTIVDDKLIGRGVQDDKGPTLSCIYAIKALLDAGVELNKRIRVIFGTDEENLWRGITRYKQNGEEIPSMGITPDSEFFCINSEKGLLQAKLSCTNTTGINLTAGNAFNSVPDKAIYSCSSEVLLALKEALDSLHFKYQVKDNDICVLGKGVHSASSSEGINAITRLAIALNYLNCNSNSIKFISDVIGEDVSLSKHLPNCEDISGKLTVNVGKVDFTADTETICLDIRIPVTISKDKVVNVIRSKAQEYCLSYEEFDWLAPSYVPADNFLIKTLKKVYEEETGLPAIPKASGGATYARAMNNCVAFGMAFPDSAETAHQPDEYITVKDLIKATEIYALAIYELTR